MSDVDRYAAEAEAIRNRIADSVETLGERLSPSRLIQDAKDEGIRALFGVRDEGLQKLHKVRDEGARALADVRDQGADVVDAVEGFVRENPIAAGAAAAFVGVLLVHNRPRPATGSPDDYDYGDSYAARASRPVSRVGRVLGAVGDKASDARHVVNQRARIAADRAADRLSGARAALADSATALAGRARASVAAVRSRVGETTDSAFDRIAVGIDSARDTTADAAHRARRVADDAARATGDAIHENPEAAVAIALIAGAFLGLAAEGGHFDREPA